MTELAGLILPLETIWIDEFDWTPISQTVETDLTGLPVVEYAHRDSGRSITLSGGWIERALLTQLEVLKNASTQPILNLTLPDGRMKTVLFRHHDGPPLLIEPIIERPNYTDAPADSPDYFNVTINLMEIV